MTVRRVLRLGLAYAAYAGAIFCLCQVPGLWARQTEALAFRPTPESEAMHDFLVVIDAGHGGVDGGTQHPPSVTLEKDLTLEVARLLEARLREEGIRTYMTRREDKQISLEERVQLANRIQPHVFVSIHMNADAESTATVGLETYYSSSKKLGDRARLEKRLGLATGEILKDRRSEWLAQTLHKGILAATGAEDRGVRDSNYIVVKQTDAPAVLIECGYLSNDAESRRLRNPAYQQKLAISIASGLKMYLLAARLNPRRGLERNPMTTAVDTPPPRPMGNP